MTAADEPKSWREIAGRPARMAQPLSETAPAGRPSLGRRVTRPAHGEDWGTYTPQDVFKRPVYVPDNDNKPQRRGTVVDLGEHREVRQETPREAPSPMRVRLNLYKSAPDQYATFCRVEELLRPADLFESETRFSADNDNNVGFGIERRHEIVPANNALEDLVQAYADGLRIRVVWPCRRSRHIESQPERFTGKTTYTQSRDGELIEIGGAGSLGRPYGVRFYRGMLLDYVKGGKRRKPDERSDAQRGPDSKAWTPRTTTSTAPRPQALTELDRARSAASFAEAMGPAAMRQLRLVLEADSFAEIGKAYGYASSGAHRHGRRIAIAALKSAQEKMAA